MMITKKTLLSMAESFIRDVNPSKWDGRGEKPKTLDTRVWEAPRDTLPNDGICITIEQDDDTQDWLSFIEIVDKEDDMMSGCLSCYSISSAEKIAESIEELLRQEFGDIIAA